MTSEQIQTLARETALKLKAWQHVDDRQSVIAAALTTVSDQEYSRGVTAGKLEAARYAPGEREAYGRHVSAWEEHCELQSKLADSERQLAVETTARKAWETKASNFREAGLNALSQLAEMTRENSDLSAELQHAQKDHDGLTLRLRNSCNSLKGANEAHDYVVSELHSVRAERDVYMDRASKFSGAGLDLLSTMNRIEKERDAALADAAKLRAALESIQKLRPVGEGSRRLIDDACDIVDAALSPQPKGGEFKDHPIIEKALADFESEIPNPKAPIAPAAPAQPDTPRTDAYWDSLIDRNPQTPNWHDIAVCVMHHSEEVERDLSAASEATAKALAELDEARRESLELREEESSACRQLNDEACKLHDALAAERTARQVAEKQRYEQLDRVMTLRAQIAEVNKALKDIRGCILSFCKVKGIDV